MLSCGELRLIDALRSDAVGLIVGGVATGDADPHNKDALTIQLSALVSQNMTLHRAPPLKPLAMVRATAGF